jgi:hypothetical protein
MGEAALGRNVPSRIGVGPSSRRGTAGKWSPKRQLAVASGHRPWSGPQGTPVGVAHGEPVASAPHQLARRGAQAPPAADDVQERLEDAGDDAPVEQSARLPSTCQPGDGRPMPSPSSATSVVETTW